MAPKHKSCDADSLDIPKRSFKGLPFRKKVKDLNKEKKLYAEVAKIDNKNESSTREIVKKKKGICASFAVAPQTAKVMATVCDRCLIKVERALISGQKT